MDLRGKTFWEMEKESISYARKNENVWTKQAIIDATLTSLEVNEQELDLAFKAQDENDPSGHVAQKNERLSTFFRKVYKLGRKLSLYAKNAVDKVLLNDVAIAETTFSLLPEKEALIKCSKIIKRGYDYLGKTADYGITAEELQSLRTELNSLEKMKPLIGVITNERKSARRSIKELIIEAHTELDKLDDAFEGLVDDDNFISGWFAVRKIKGRHKPKEVVAQEPAIK